MAIPSGKLRLPGSWSGSGVVVETGAGNEGPQSFHNHGEGPTGPQDTMLSGR